MKIDLTLNILMKIILWFTSNGEVLHYLENTDLSQTPNIKKKCYWFTILLNVNFRSNNFFNDIFITLKG